MNGANNFSGYSPSSFVMISRFLFLMFCLVTFLHPVEAVYDGDWTVQIVAGKIGNPGKVDGKGRSARFGYIGGIAVDDSGTVFVADSTNHLIRRVGVDGSVTTLAGSTRGDRDGTGAGAQLSFPKQIVVDGVGDIYVSETKGVLGTYGLQYRVRKITSKGVTITLATGTGIVDCLAVYGPARNKLAFSLKWQEGIRTISTSGGGVSMLTVPDLGDGRSGPFVANRRGELFVFGGGRSVSRLSGAGWTSFPIDEETQLQFSLSGCSLGVDSDQNFFSSALTVGVWNGERTWSIVGGGKTDWKRVWEGAAPNVSGDSSVLAVSPVGIVYFGGPEGWPYWEYEDVWLEISKFNLKDFSEVESLSWKTLDALGSGWLYELKYALGGDTENSALRQAMPFYCAPLLGAQRQHLIGGQRPQELRVGGGGVGTEIYQWYRSGVKIPLANSPNYLPMDPKTGKAVPGSYQIEISYGAGNDRAVWISEPMFVTVEDLLTREARSLIASANSSNWQQRLNQVTSLTVINAAKSGDAAFMNAVAMLGSLLGQIQSSGLMAAWGFQGEANPFNWTLKHTGQFPSGTLSADARAFLLSKVFPTLSKVDSQLALVTDRNFICPLPVAENINYQGVVDFADVQGLRALVKAAMWAIKWVESMNTDFSVNDILAAYSGGRLSISWILAKYPLLLDATKSGATALTESVKHCKAAIDCYLTWSDFVRAVSMPGRLRDSQEYLISLDANASGEENVFRGEMAKMRTALDNGSTQSFYLGKDWGESAYFGAKARTPVVLRVKPQALIAHPAGWRKEVVSLGFTQNLAAPVALTNVKSVANTTLRTTLPDLTTSDFSMLQSALIHAEPKLNKQLRTRWDVESPKVTIDPIGTKGKINGGDGWITVSGKVMDASVVTAIWVTRTASGQEQELVGGMLEELPGSVERNRMYSWTALVPVVAGVNTIRVFARDVWNQVTEPPPKQEVSVAVQYPVEIELDGEGDVKSTPSLEVGALTGLALLEAGAGVRIQAVPKPDWVFRYYEIYVDGQEQERVTIPVFDLKIRGATRIIPVFHPDPFRFMSGPITLSANLFNGDPTLLPDGQDALHRMTTLTATVNKSGTVSGRVRIGRISHTFSGQFSPEGILEVKLPPRRGFLIGDSGIENAVVIAPTFFLTCNTDYGTPRLQAIVRDEYALTDDGGYGDAYYGVTVGELKSVELSTSLRFNVKGSASGFSWHYGQVHVSSTGQIALVGGLPVGEKITGAGRIQSLPWWGRRSEFLPSQEDDVPSLGAHLFPISSNKYSVISYDVGLFSPEETGGSLWKANVRFQRQRLSSRNQWVTGDGVGSTKREESSDEGSGQGYQFLSLNALMRGFGSSIPSTFRVDVDSKYSWDRVGYLAFTHSTLAVDSSRIASESLDYPSIVASGPNLMKWFVNPLTGSFVCTVGWYADGLSGRKLVGPRKFTGVLTQWDTRQVDPLAFGIGLSAEGPEALFIEALRY